MSVSMKLTSAGSVSHRKPRNVWKLCFDNFDLCFLFVSFCCIPSSCPCWVVGCLSRWRQRFPSVSVTSVTTRRPLDLTTIRYSAHWNQMKSVTSHHHSSPVITSHHQSSAVITSHHQSSPVITSHQHSSPVISSHHQSSPVISSHHQSSAVITGPSCQDPGITFPSTPGTFDKCLASSHWNTINLINHVLNMDYIKYIKNTSNQYHKTQRQTAFPICFFLSPAWGLHCVTTWPTFEWPKMAPDVMLVDPVLKTYSADLFTLLSSHISCLLASSSSIIFRLFVSSALLKLDPLSWGGNQTATALPSGANKTMNLLWPWSVAVFVLWGLEV